MGAEKNVDSSEFRQPSVLAKTKFSCDWREGSQKKKECVAQKHFWQLCPTAESMEAPKALMSGPLLPSGS